MIIDIHTHMINGDDLDNLVLQGGAIMKKRIEISPVITPRRPHATQVASRVDQMDRFGIDYQLATPIPTLDPTTMPVEAETSLRVCRAINEGMARITEKSRGRVLCAGAVPLDALEKGGLREMERAIKELGLKGFSVMTNIKGKPLDAPEFRPFWARAEELGAVIFIHPLDLSGNYYPPYETEYDLALVFGWPFETTLTLSRLVFSGVMEEYPNLKIVSHHLGGMIPFYWGRIEECYAPEFAARTKVNLKRPLKEYFSRFYYDTAVGNNPGAIRCTYELFGVERLVFATDAPFGPASGDERLRTYPGIINSLGLSQNDSAKILSGNARRILGM